MWIEKYRPRRLDDIEGQAEVVELLRSFAERKELPNLLLWGHRGVGKTTSVLALANELYGSYENLIRVECSDFIEQRKKWLREDKLFRRYYDESKSAMVIFKDMMREYAALAPINARFKMLVFCNADMLPADIQQALRRIMERFSRTSRFIFVTTRPGAIIPAIRSRCLNLHFLPLDKTGAMDRLLRNIAEHEGLELTGAGLAMVKRYAAGDAGVAINIMEAASVSSRRIDGREVMTVVRAAMERSNKVRELIEEASSGRYDKLRAKLKELIQTDKMSGKDIVAELHDAILRTQPGERSLAKIMIYLGDADYRLCEAFNSMIHIEELLVKISRAGAGIRTQVLGSTVPRDTSTTPRHHTATQEAPSE